MNNYRFKVFIMNERMNITMVLRIIRFFSNKVNTDFKLTDQMEITIQCLFKDFEIIKVLS